MYKVMIVSDAGVFKHECKEPVIKDGWLYIYNEKFRSMAYNMDNITSYSITKIMRKGEKNNES